VNVSPEQLVQGPIADALTHVGQITLMRRLAGSPIRGENYLRADIAPGPRWPRAGPPESGVRLGPWTAGDRHNPVTLQFLRTESVNFWQNTARFEWGACRRLPEAQAGRQR
jgi:hypothetical protein